VTAKDSTAGTTSSNSNTTSTAECIPLHHPFINKTEIQRDAEELFAKMLLWLSKGGPQGFLFTPRLMSVLGQTVAAIGTMRPSHGVNAARSITFLITGKVSNVSEMTAIDKEHLARAATRLSRATAVYTTDPEGQMTKLKTAITSLGVTTVMEGDMSNLSGKKRDVSEVLDDIDALDTSEEHHSAILAALEASQQSKTLQLAKASAATETLFQSNKLSSGVKLRHIVNMDENTELSADLIALQSLSSYESATKLVSIENISSIVNGKKQDDIACIPIMVIDTQEYSDLAIFTLLKIMDNYQALRIAKDKVRQSTVFFCLYMSILTILYAI
jgi:hypothetical protein